MSNGTIGTESRAAAAEERATPDDGPVDRLSHRAGTALVGLAAVHVACFLPDGVEALDDWLGGALWTLDRGTGMTGTDAAFWALPGGIGVPLGLLGLVVRHQARQGTPPPAALGWGLGAWALAASLLTEPSGFPVLLAPAGMLVVAARRARRGDRGGRRAPARPAAGVTAR